MVAFDPKNKPVNLAGEQDNTNGPTAAQEFAALAQRYGQNNYTPDPTTQVRRGAIPDELFNRYGYQPVKELEDTRLPAGHRSNQMSNQEWIRINAQANGAHSDRRMYALGAGVAFLTNLHLFGAGFGLIASGGAATAGLAPLVASTALTVACAYCAFKAIGSWLQKGRIQQQMLSKE